MRMRYVPSWYVDAQISKGCPSKQIKVKKLEKDFSLSFHKSRMLLNTWQEIQRQRRSFARARVRPVLAFSKRCLLDFSKLGRRVSVSWDNQLPTPTRCRVSSQTTLAFQKTAHPCSRGERTMRDSFILTPSWSEPIKFYRPSLQEHCMVIWAKPLDDFASRAYFSVLPTSACRSSPLYPSWTL